MVRVLRLDDVGKDYLSWIKNVGVWLLIVKSKATHPSIELVDGLGMMDEEVNCLLHQLQKRQRKRSSPKGGDFRENP